MSINDNDRFVNKYIPIYIYLSYVLRNAASSSGPKGQRFDSHVDQRTPLRAGPNLPNKKEKRWGRHWTSSNTSPESTSETTAVKGLCWIETLTGWWLTYPSEK